MGVHGLWKLIESAGKPVPVETLENKILAVDVSIWLHQLMKGYQTPAGASFSNAYLLGLFSRVCKLLFTNVKPVFVFDGGVPQLKKKTIAARQQQKDKSVQASEKLREQLLKNLLKQKAVGQVLEEIRGQTSPKKKAPDMFELPPMPQLEESDVEEMSCSSSEEDVKPKMKFKDLHTIDVKSEEFKSLPADMRHDILTELKETRKQNSWGRIHEMPEESGDFSKYQMARLLKRRSVQVSLEEAEKEMGGRTLSIADVEALLADGGIEINPQLGKRIAADNTTRFIYVTGTGESRSQIKDNLISAEKSDMRSTTLMKDEIIDCDALSDSELIQELEHIERVYNEMVVKKEEIDPLDDIENQTMTASATNVIPQNIYKDTSVDSDLSDTEVIKGAGNIGAVYNDYEDENMEFGTDNMFDNESSSEGVIIDSMDLVNDNSGLSQEQILALIKQEQHNKSKLIGLMDETMPSTSKVTHQDITQQFKSSKPISKGTKLDLNNILSQQKLSDDSSISKFSETTDSKIRDSLYFKMMPRMKCFDPNHETNDEVKEHKSEVKIDNKSCESINTAKTNTINTTATEIKKTNDTKSAPTISDLKAKLLARREVKNVQPCLNVIDHKKLADSLAFNLSNPKTKANNDLPCVVSEISLPVSKSSVFIKSGNEKASTSTSVLQSTDSGMINDSTPSHTSPSSYSNTTTESSLNKTGKSNVHRKNNPNSSTTSGFLHSNSSHSRKMPSNETKIATTEVKKKKNIFEQDDIADSISSEPKSHVVKSSSTDKKNYHGDKTQIPFLVNTKLSHSSSGQSSQIVKLPPESKGTDKINLGTTDKHPEPKSFSKSKLHPHSNKACAAENHSLQNKEINCEVNVSEAEHSTSSESDGDFLEVPQNSDSNLISESFNATCGLQIEIERTQVPLEDDIFADIFTNNKDTSNKISRSKQYENEGFTHANAIVAGLQFNGNMLHDKNDTPVRSYVSKAQASKCVIKDLDLSGVNHLNMSINNPSHDEYEELEVQKETTSHQTTNKVEIASETVKMSKDVTINILSNYKPDNGSTDSGNVSKHLDEQVTENSYQVAGCAETETLNSPTSEEKPKRKLNMKQLEKLQEILETKEREIVIDQNREDRMATSITDQMYQEAQDLLRLFGVPYVVAPMEAEAQCAFMDYTGLTQGTITDDSDIWLFGGNKVYKNFFDQKKFVLEFQANDIQNYFKLNRSLMILLALLVGSDYTVGLQGVGPVTAMEILATFPPQPNTTDTHQLLASLQRFRDWWEARPATHAALAKKLRNIELHQGFPSSAVVSAYFQPLVDDSREPFSWGEPDLPGLRDYAERKFGWSRNRTDQILLPVVNRLNKKSSQTTLHTFFGAIPNISAHKEQMSKRVQSAVNRLEGGAESFEPVEPRPRQPRGRGRGRASDTADRGSNARGRGRVRARGRGGDVEEQFFVHGSVGTPPEVIPQREKDKEAAVKRKQQAIDLFKTKKNKRLRKRKNVRQEKEKANLSESSSDDN